MSVRVKSVERYLKELRDSKKEKPQQVKDGIEIYIELWEKAIKRGIVSPDDDVESALQKIDASGGLYKAAED
ncbi:MAG: hypothetical protein HYU03_04075 [Thaumarchaeota archaeon]|nr:hypothetical protein [Nitrososphaerota archaeon]MBI3023317.1 hypothetical protein [Nitrososphaerota archaeon]MBI3116981.1 hypothetical protein [Nitrososphaerota archaeon]MCS4539850.1 hypothetical protein [Nitrososphaerota archaeon]